MPPTPALTALVHLAGFGTGVALYAMLGVMVARAGRRSARPASPADASIEPADRIPLATAVLGVTWNLGALVLYPMRDLGLAPQGAGGPTWLLALGTVAFGALGVLPAVAGQAAAQPVARRARHALTAAAYALSAAAAALQGWGAVNAGTVPARPALVLLTVGYAVVLTLLALRLRRQPAGRAPLAAAALAAFAVTALHLSHHASDESVTAHLLGDHASIPLALVILYQDYRFAFADRFLKRALAGLVLVGLALAVHLLVVAPFVAPRLATDPADPVGTALGVGVLAAALATALAAASLGRRLIDGLVDRLLLRRADYVELRRELAAAVADAQTPAAVLDAVAARLAPALSAGTVTWREQPAADAGWAPAVDTLVHADARGRAADVDLPVTEGPGYRLHVGALRAGRRLLSDDLALLEWAATQAARRVDLVRVAHERCEREARELEAVRLTTEAELRALRAQLNPHFLFNALTTIGYLVQTAPDRAVGTLYELTGLLRAVLSSPAGDLVPLGDELAIVEAYLAIEGARFEERLQVTVDADAAARAARVPSLLVQPLVENAVKHGVAPLKRGGEVRVWARVEPGDGDASGAGPRLHVRVSDSGAGASGAELVRRRAAGFGLASVERRLERLYGAAATFAFRSHPGHGTTVEFTLPVTSPVEAAARDAGGPDAQGEARVLRIAS